jgi:uncharacterized protein (TIGR02217 family)
MTDFQAFHDVLFPLSVAFGSTVTRERKVEVLQFASGREQRNLRFAHSRRTYDAGNGVRSIADVRAVMDFFEARRGPLASFRFRDPVDNASTASGGAVTPLDQVIGAGDGAVSRFKLTKAYGDSADVYLRPVRRPVDGTLRVAVNGVEAMPADFGFDSATGEIVFAPGKTPGAGASVTAGFQFHVEVRFASDTMSVNVSAFEAGELPSIPLIEVMA